MAGVPYQVARKLYGVSESYYRALREPAECVMKRLFVEKDVAKGAILLTKDFRDRCVLALSFYCRASIAGIVLFFALVLGQRISKGTIYNIRERARIQAEEYERHVPFEGIASMATDEIFQQNKPVLACVDLESGYIPLMKAAPNRSGETWAEAMEELKARGLCPVLNVSDGGSGLRKGIPEAFPEIAMQWDVFHALRDLGGEVNRITKSDMKQLRQYCDMEIRVKGKKVRTKTRREYETLCGSIDRDLTRGDTIRILHTWLREMTDFSGYGYQTSLTLCNWILDEMTALYPERVKLQDAIRSFRDHLPEILGFLPRLFQRLEAAAADFSVRRDTFLLLYHQRIYPFYSEPYRFLEKRLYHRFGNRLPEARGTLEHILSTTFRASSLIENVNGRIRCFMDLKREIPEKFFPLLKFFLNTKKAQRPFLPDWKGTSALDRLTGHENPEFLDLLLGPMNYVYTHK